jgi:hypothetical protein
MSRFSEMKIRARRKFEVICFLFFEILENMVFFLEEQVACKIVDIFNSLINSFKTYLLLSNYHRNRFH